MWRIMELMHLENLIIDKKIKEEKLKYNSYGIETEMPHEN